MKNKIIILFILVFIFTGCTSTKKSNNEKVLPKKESPVETETFLGEYYINFPTVRNIAHYLNLSQEDVKILSQTNKKIIFSFTIDPAIDVHDESIISYSNYIKILESEGYQLTIYDGTISQTFKLENEKYTISITCISKIDEWKDVHKDIDNIDKLINENMVFEIIKNP